jgi:hypothetical protein
VNSLSAADLAASGTYVYLFQDLFLSGCLITAISVAYFLVINHSLYQPQPVMFERPSSSSGGVTHSGPASLLRDLKITIFINYQSIIQHNFIKYTLDMKITVDVSECCIYSLVRHVTWMKKRKPGERYRDSLVPSF